MKIQFAYEHQYFPYEFLSIGCKNLDICLESNELDDKNKQVNFKEIMHINQFGLRNYSQIFRK